MWSINPSRTSTGRWYLTALKPIQMNVYWFDAVEGIILLPIGKQRLLGVVSIGCFYFLEILWRNIGKGARCWRGKQVLEAGLPKFCVLFMVAGKVWYVSGVTVFRLERLGTGYLFRNSLPVREKWVEMVNCNCGQTVCVLNKGTEAVRPFFEIINVSLQKS